MSITRSPATTLRGLSFSVPELILARTWAQARSLGMEIRLDHGSDTDEYEEVLALRAGNSARCLWIMWRDEAAVFVQPVIGCTHRHASVAEAFEALNTENPLPP